MLSTAFTAAPNPTLVRISPATLTLCSMDPNVTLTYTLSSSVAGAPFNLVPTTTSAAMLCTATPSTTSELHLVHGASKAMCASINNEALSGYCGQIRIVAEAVHEVQPSSGISMTCVNVTIV